MRRNPPIEFACNMSHIKAVIKSYNDERPIFFEDDVVFCEGHDSVSCEEGNGRYISGTNDENYCYLIILSRN